MTDRYVILKGERDGKPWIGSADREYKAFPEKSKFPWVCEIWIQLRKVDEAGFPSKEEFQYLETFENQLLERISKKAGSYPIGKITWNGKRYLLAYVIDAKKASETLEEIIVSKTHNWEFEYKIEKDPEWTAAGKSFEFEN